MIEKVLPAIRAKWPHDDLNKPIYIQQDNAPSHIEVDDPLFCEAAQQDGFDIRLKCQLANSPDFNILDLGFFVPYNQFSKKKQQKQCRTSFQLCKRFVVLSINSIILSINSVY
jgi:hypothetical protein